MNIFSCCCTPRDGEVENEKALLLEGGNKNEGKKVGLNSSSSGSNTQLTPPVVQQQQPQNGDNIVGNQTVVVMRHAERLDEIEPSWSQLSQRPWDPAITPHGVQQARIITNNLHKYNFDVIVSSPFTRTIQTSTEVIRTLTASGSRSNKNLEFFVHPGLSEIVSPTSFYLSEGDMVSRGPLKEWFAMDRQWQSFDRSVYDQAWKEGEDSFEYSESRRPEIQFMDGDFPPNPEDKEEGHDRYLRIIKQLAEQFNTKNVLIVTHGESLQSAVGFCIPHTVVYEVKHCGYVVMSRNKLNTGEFTPFNIFRKNRIEWMTFQGQ
eukprot:TRINITY_DN14804_c1_g1_i1.p1 TRINITY_DN14804_c1_g1~~TRINITY_DN14804_c1_g1_i1.p1  ORF type:complete len:319 (-),score=59.75 TRINITY_DN14804_c1_g1_i1:258-1214(-)